jgi:ssDNA-binding Zn-finger/Zn-ribbon topoisomerase 1
VSILKKKKSTKTKTKAQNLRCPYCGGSVVLRSADGIYKDNSSGTMLFVCSHYPACDAYVRVKPGTTTPVGSLADGNLRALRLEAHRHFDLLHQTGLMTREEAYLWLAATLQSPLSKAHIGFLGEYYCRQVIAESEKLLANHRKAKRGENYAAKR